MFGSHVIGSVGVGVIMGRRARGRTLRFLPLDLGEDLPFWGAVGTNEQMIN